jgi:hypothetical protein
MPLNREGLLELRHWISEREHIRRQKERGDPKPWTSDPILQQFKFCNVHREDDKVTRWFAANWRHSTYWDHKNFVPAIILGRTINWPDTLEYLGFPYEWDKVAYYNKLCARAESGKKVYTGAYMVSQYGSKLPKNVLVMDNADYYFKYTPPILDTLEDTYEELLMYSGVGPFMAGQVLADLKQTKLLQNAPDWSTWACLGPGSSRGLNRLYDRNLNFQPSQKQGLEEMREVRSALGNYNPTEVMCLQDLQNCLCEFDKYMRTTLGQGVPRSRYDGYGA